MAKKILTVDDSKTIRMIVARAFKPFDCDILEAANGVEGLAMATKEKPDVIILDLTMPVMDGYEMLTKLKAIPELKGIPVVMLTAEAGKDNVLRIAKLGVRDYLIKPFKEDVILERVGRIIDLQPKVTAAAGTKKFSDPLKLLVVDDKPAIIEQVRAALASTTWQVEGVAQAKPALDSCVAAVPDAVLASLSLPDNGAFTLFDGLRANLKTKQLPVFGMSVKTAAAEQQRAEQAGFAGNINKPIDAEDLQAKVSFALSLDTSERYFSQRDGVLAVTIPATYKPATAQDITKYVEARLTDAVESGLDKVVIDFSLVRSADQELITCVASTLKLCRELGLRYGLISSEALAVQCTNFPESRAWKLASNWVDVLAFLANPQKAA